MNPPDTMRIFMSLHRMVDETNIGDDRILAAGGDSRNILMARQGNYIGRLLRLLGMAIAIRSRWRRLHESPPVAKLMQSVAKQSNEMTANPYANLEFDLIGEIVNLIPLQRHHGDSLLEAAADGELWNSKFTVVPDAKMIDQYIDTALSCRQSGTELPFVIVHRSTGKIVGSTRFLRIDPTNRGLEVGHTWLAKSAQRTAVNTEAKYLLLKHAFEVMEFIRVQFTTDELNEVSRAAILRIGAKQEGIIRNERIMPDGRKRNSARFSIIDTEWDHVKATLLAKMAILG